MIFPSKVSNNELNADTDALENCKKVVLQPYLSLIKLVLCWGRKWEKGRKGKIDKGYRKIVT